MRLWVSAGNAARTQALRLRLERLGLAALPVQGPQAAAGAEAAEADLLVVELGGVAASEACPLRSWRDGHPSLPILVLAGGAAVEERIQALDGGADDCVPSDVGDAELAARIRVRLRRVHGLSARYIHCGPLAYDPADRTVLLNGWPLRLSLRELELLETLMRRPGRLTSPQALQERFFERNERASLNSVQVYVCRLRRKLRHEPVQISTVRGEGYRLLVKPRAASQGAANGP
jgi:DNA-binding response OmpR family regulator